MAGDDRRCGLGRLDPKTNQVVVAVEVGKRICSALAAGFGSVWVPVCGDKSLVRVDAKTNQVTATLPFAPGSVACVFGEGSARF